jgi:hypothetical protein
VGDGGLVRVWQQGSRQLLQEGVEGWTASLGRSGLQEVVSSGHGEGRVSWQEWQCRIWNMQRLEEQD